MAFVHRRQAKWPHSSGAQLVSSFVRAAHAEIFGGGSLLNPRPAETSPGSFKRAVSLFSHWLIGASSPALLHRFSPLPLPHSPVSSCLMSTSLLQCSLFALVFRHYFWSSRLSCGRSPFKRTSPSVFSCPPSITSPHKLCTSLLAFYLSLFPCPSGSFPKLFSTVHTIAFFPRPSVFPFPCLFHCFVLSVFPVKQRDFSFLFLSISSSVLPPPSLTLTLLLPSLFPGPPVFFFLFS